MKKEGLLIEPQFSNIEEYLQSGERTAITNKINAVSKVINGRTDGMLVRELLVWINQNTRRLHKMDDSRKFRRTASEILQSKERTGCCDSSTLFTALARSKGIPAMQIITLSKEWGKKIDRGKETGTLGHYFTACYLKDISGKSDWVLIDSDRMVQDIRDVRLGKLDRNNRNIERDFYAFAYTKDYSDVVCNGLKISSIEEMRKIQMEAYRMCDKSDFAHPIERER